MCFYFSRYSLWRHDGRLDIIDLINGVLGSLVSITAGCFLYRAWEALIIGLIGALLCVLAMPVFDRMGVDDPVGASAVHGVCGIWVRRGKQKSNENERNSYIFLEFYRAS